MSDIRSNREAFLQKIEALRRQLTEAEAEAEAEMQHPLTQQAQPALSCSSSHSVAEGQPSCSSNSVAVVQPSCSSNSLGEGQCQPSCSSNSVAEGQPSFSSNSLAGRQLTCSSNSVAEGQPSFSSKSLSEGQGNPTCSSKNIMVVTEIQNPTNSVVACSDNALVSCQDQNKTMQFTMNFNISLPSTSTSSARDSIAAVISSFFGGKDVSSANSLNISGSSFFGGKDVSSANSLNISENTNPKRNIDIQEISSDEEQISDRVLRPSKKTCVLDNEDDSSDDDVFFPPSPTSWAFSSSAAKVSSVEEAKKILSLNTLKAKEATSDLFSFSPKSSSLRTSDLHQQSDRAALRPSTSASPQPSTSASQPASSKAKTTACTSGSEPSASGSNDTDPENLPPGMCKVCRLRPVDSILACKHLFCNACLLRWKQIQPTCPTCRRRFRKWKPIYLA